MESISSKQNPKIKQLLLLEKSSERRKTGLFKIEGLREIEKSISSGYKYESVFFSKSILNENDLKSIFGSALPTKVYEVNDAIFSKIAYRESSGGIVGVARSKSHKLSEFQLSGKPLFLVLEGVEKPGNIGAIYRTAEASGINGIILTDVKADIYNPNAIRSSLGCVFKVPTIIEENSKVIHWLKSNDIHIYPTYLKAAKNYSEIDYAQSSAIVMGTESTGITSEWIEGATQNIIIPMYGEVDSLNVSTSAAIVIFEAIRQRNKK